MINMIGKSNPFKNRRKTAIICFAIILYSGFYSSSFAQTKVQDKKGTQGFATGGYKPNRPETPPKTINSNPGTYRNDCFKSLVFTVKNYGYNKDGKFYSWGVKVVNNYKKAVQLKYKLIVGNDKSHVGTLTYFIAPGATYSNDFGTAKAIIVKNSSDKYEIEVTDVCLEGMDCTKYHVDCDLKQQPNTPIRSSTANTMANGGNTYTSSKSISVNSLVKLLKSTEGADNITLLDQVKAIFQNTGYKFIKIKKGDAQLQEDDTFVFDKFELQFYEDGVDRGFFLEFINRQELLNFKKLAGSSYAQLKSTSTPTGIMYWYGKK